MADGPAPASSAPAVSSPSSGRRLRLPLALLTLLIVPGLAFAQVSASISGRVEDASGGGIKDATVTVRSLETGASRVVMSDDAGNFRVLSLPLGPQEVKAEKNGFKPVLRTGINLEVGEDAVINLRLESAGSPSRYCERRDARRQHHNLLGFRRRR